MRLKKADTLLVLTSLCIATLLVISWFRFRALIAYSEEGILFYRPELVLQKYKYLWVDAGLGYPNPFYYPRLPLIYFASILAMLGLNGWISQAITFFVLLISPLLLLPKLVDEMVPRNNNQNIVKFTVVLFYIFNLFTMSQVWGRFILPLIFAWSYFPLFLWLWIKVIKNSKGRYLLYLLISSVIFSTSFGLPSGILVLFLPVGIYLVNHLLAIRTDVHKVILNFVKNLFFWLCFNIWWLYPEFLISRASYSSILHNNSSMTSLVDVSRYYPLQEIIFLKQSFLFNDNIVFKEFYSLTVPRHIGYLILAISFIGLYTALKKYRDYSYILLLFLFSFFIIKGTNPPFGKEFYQLLFNKIPLSQVLRNPYEKAGVVFMFVYGLFFALGAGVLTKASKSKLVLVVITLILLYYTQPFWKGFVFPAYAHVNVPSYYRIADDNLSANSRHRAIQLPLSYSDSVTYDWNYNAGSHLDQFYSFPVINIPGVLQNEEYYHLLRAYQRHDNFSRFFELLDIDTVIINEDVVDKPTDVSTSDAIESTKSWEKVRISSKHDSINVFKYTNNVNGRIFAVGELIKFNNLNDAFNHILNNEFDPKRTGFYIDDSVSGAEYINNNNLPKIIVRKINPTYYHVDVKNAEDPYFIILVDSYNEFWNLTEEGIENNNHFKINGISNGWLVNKKGNYSLEIKYKIWPWE